MVLSWTSPGTGFTEGQHKYGTYTINEYNVPSYTGANGADALAFGIYNSSNSGSNPFQFVVNQSTTGTKNNMSYTSSQNVVTNAPNGFITERGSKVASETPSTLTVNLAKVVDTLQFVVGPVVGVTTSNTVTSQSVGPVGVGQAVPGFSNLTVSKVNATCTFASTSCSVSGLSNLTATPSVTSAVVPVELNTATTPLVVLDSNANSAATLIVVGSLYVNSVAQQVFAQNPSLNSSFGPSSVVASAEGTNRILVAGYTANQTVTAGNEFINQLLQAAGGVIQFESEYTNLEANFTKYFTSVSSLSPSNLQSGIGSLSAAFSNISSITNYMYQNPIFPPPATADYSACIGYGSSTSNVPSQGGPWYCSSLGFCDFLTYNYSLLGNIQTYVNQISSLPITNQQISQIALQINTNENIYIAPILTEKKLNQARNIINTTLSGYNSTTSDATTLLTHISNTTLQNDLAKVQANYSTLKTGYVSANLTKLNKTLATQYSNLKIVYSKLNATYTLVVNSASNNTVALIELQTGNNKPSVKITALSFREAELNSQLGGSVKNISALKLQLDAVNTASKSLSNNPSFVQDTERFIGAPFAKVILAQLNTPYSSALELVPVFSLIPALILGIIFLVALFYVHSNLTKKNKLAHNTRTAKNWNILFILAGIVVLLFLATTYVVASGANQNAPISIFISSIHSSKTVIIALNGTNNTAMISCADKTKAALVALNKKTQIITMSGIACNNGMPLETTDKCLSYYAANNEPVIIFTNSSLDAITTYSYYGSIMNVNGNTQFMNTCIASTMIR
jgi:hypothetical protein